MKYGLGQMDELVDKILRQELPYHNIVLVGDNSSGKSVVLKNIIKEKQALGKIYFIDSVNRYFDIRKITGLEKRPQFKNTILNTRLDEEHFNLLDSFNFFGTSTERIEMLYLLYEKELQVLFEKITDNSFTRLENDLSGNVQFKEYSGVLSSGYQALVRILLELIYYQDTVIKKGQKAWVVIDEIDEFLSPKYSATILEFLKNEFTWAEWIVTTHSADLVANTKNASLIMLYHGFYEVLDINDFNSASEVQLVFARLYGMRDFEKNNTDDTLRRLLNNKINDAWSKKDENTLNKISGDKLSASQKLILRQIKEW